MNTEKVKDKVVRYLLGVVTGDVRQLQTAVLSPHLAARISAYDKNGVPIPVDKLKAAEILLKYLTSDNATANGDRVIIYGENDIYEEDNNDDEHAEHH